MGSILGIPYDLFSQPGMISKFKFKSKPWTPLDQVKKVLLENVGKKNKVLEYIYSIHKALILIPGIKQHWRWPWRSFNVTRHGTRVLGWCWWLTWLLELSSTTTNYIRNLTIRCSTSDFIITGRLPRHKHVYDLIF